MESRLNPDRRKIQKRVTQFVSFLLLGIANSALAQSEDVTQETLFPPTERTVIRWVFPQHRQFLRAVAVPTPMGARIDRITQPGAPRSTLGYTWEPRFRLESCGWRDEFDRSCPTILGPMMSDGYVNHMRSIGFTRFPTFENARRLCSDPNWTQQWLSGNAGDVSPLAVAAPILTCSPIQGHEGASGAWIPQPRQGLSGSQLMRLAE